MRRRAAGQSGLQQSQFIASVFAGFLVKCEHCLHLLSVMCLHDGKDCGQVCAAWQFRQARFGRRPPCRWRRQRKLARCVLVVDEVGGARRLEDTLQSASKSQRQLQALPFMWVTDSLPKAPDIFVAFCNEMVGMPVDVLFREERYTAQGGGHRGLIVQCKAMGCTDSVVEAKAS